jgi:hypothetical protein
VDVPGVAGGGLLAASFARGDYDFIAEESSVRERPCDVIRGAGVCVRRRVGADRRGPRSAGGRLRPTFRPRATLRGNTLSAALDNATLAALESHGVAPLHLWPALLSMAASGGMLIPVNIPNIVRAGIFCVGSAEWARVGAPSGWSCSAFPLQPYSREVRRNYR